MDYMEDIECDFLVLYRMNAEDCESGPQFIKLASRLPYYQGAVRAKMEMYAREEMQEQETLGLNQPQETQRSQDSDFTPGQTMSMAEALGRSKTKTDNFDDLNRESMAAGMGALFERVVV